MVRVTKATLNAGIMYEITNTKAKKGILVVSLIGYISVSEVKANKAKK
jgi:hypothetical protein